MSPRPLGQGEQVPQSLEQHVHPGERTFIQKHPQSLTATEACVNKQYTRDTNIPLVHLKLQYNSHFN